MSELPENIAELKNEVETLLDEFKTLSSTEAMNPDKRPRMKQVDILLAKSRLRLKQELMRTGLPPEAIDQLKPLLGNRVNYGRASS